MTIASWIKRVFESHRATTHSSGTCVVNLKTDVFHTLSVVRHRVSSDEFGSSAALKSQIRIVLQGDGTSQESDIV